MYKYSNREMASKVTKKKKAVYTSYRVFVHRILKAEHPNIGVGGPALTVLDKAVQYLIKMLMYHADVARRQEGVKTITSRHVQTAVRLWFPGEMAKRAVTAGTKILARYTTYMTRKEKESEKASISNVIGLHIPVSRVKKAMKKYTSDCSCRVSDSGAVYLASVVEYVIGEMIDVSSHLARDNKKARIVSRHIFLGVRNDRDLDRIFHNFIISSDVLPGIHPSLLKPKAKK